MKTLGDFQGSRPVELGSVLREPFGMRLAACEIVETIAREGFADQRLKAKPMKLVELIEALSAPAAYPHPVDAVEVCQTHISVVFLAGPFAYKIKKPVSLGFLDFSTLALRRDICEREVDLNRRLARSVYLGAVPITRGADGVQVDGSGEVIEWAVKMNRLPESARIVEAIHRGDIGVEHMQSLAVRIATFHSQAATSEAISKFGRFEVVAGNARENFDQSAPHIGTTVSAAVFDRLKGLMEATLAGLRSTIDDRAARGVPRDGHGDLRLDHIYLFPDQSPPDDLVVIDCIEFNERFRSADPVADMAFLVMELVSLGRRDLANAFADAYFRAADDHEGRMLLPFYTSYRALVRGKVEGMELSEPEVPESEKAAARSRARGHWLLALSELELSAKRPCLVLIGGLPGTGKSTLARSLADRAGFSVIRSDKIRKELAGLTDATDASAEFNKGIYSPAWNKRTYTECLRLADLKLFEGERVLVDASFRAEADRRRFLEAAARWSVPSLLLICKAEPDVIRRRLEVRQGDVSDADWSIYGQAAANWDELSPITKLSTREIATDTGPEIAIAMALANLEAAGLWVAQRTVGSNERG